MSDMNIGRAVINPGDDAGSWMDEGSKTMKAVNEVPGMNSMAYFHDYFVGSLPRSLQEDKTADLILSKGTIPTATVQSSTTMLWVLRGIDIYLIPRWARDDT
jgi:hypothetical protein